ncbi:MAG: single-stranded-DNA-specific exonuclease RecJ [Gemmatimonadales bacterium]
MRGARSRWRIVPPADSERASALAAALSIPDTLATLLIQRGFDSADSAKSYLRPDLESLSDPSLLTGIEQAVDTIARAVKHHRRILVHGDYDVDGQCGTAMLTRLLREADADVVPFVPHRVRDGYDFGPAGLAKAREVGAGLIVTCDCGTTAREAVRQARDEELAVVVTDHHLTREAPAADAVVNPQQAGCESPSKELCGTGVVFKLAQALTGPLGLPGNLPFHMLDLVALATVADVVPLTGENRILVHHCLKLLRRSRWPGIQALVDVVGLTGREIRAGHLGFILAPRLNAAGRIGEAMDGVEALLCDDIEEARRYARKLDTINARRQAMDEEILEQAVEEIERAADLDRRYGLVLARDGWHPGVIGLVASRVVERYARPTVLIALEGNEGRGSGRSIHGFDLHDALVSCSEHLTRFGGHRMAAGLTVERDRVAPFREAFDAVARDRLTEDDLIPTQRIDAIVSIEQLTPELERLLRHLEPTGQGNPAPVLGVKGARARAPRVVGSNHLKFTLEDGSGELDAIGFEWADRVDPDWGRGPVDVALKLETNEWRGIVKLQARVVDIRRGE